jgi:hypothetical protein
MKASENHYPALLSAILFVIAALLLFAVGLFMGVGAFASVFTGAKIQAQQTIFLVAFGFEGLVLLVAAFFAFQKFLQKPAADQEAAIPMPNWLILVAVIVALVAFLIGYQISRMATVDWIVLPVLTIPAIVLPLGVLLAFGTKKLPFGTRWQTWNVLGLAMSITPFLLFILEIIAAVIIFFIVFTYISAQPELASELQRLSRQIMVIGRNPEAVLELLAPFLTEPAVIVTALLYMAALVPALEELFKPLGVWLFAGKLKSQAQGFTLGALSGAGYALIETIGVSGQTAEWAGLLFTRIGTGLLHITTSALMGGAIVLAWRERRYLYLFGVYLLAVLLHGLWNTTAVLFSFSSIAEFLEQEGVLSTMQPTLLIAMAVLAIGLFAILVTSNRKLRKPVSPPPLEPAIPEESTDGVEVVKE